MIKKIDDNNQRNSIIKNLYFFGSIINIALLCVLVVGTCSYYFKIETILNKSSKSNEVLNTTGQLIEDAGSIYMIYIDHVPQNEQALQVARLQNYKNNIKKDINQLRSQIQNGAIVEDKISTELLIKKIDAGFGDFFNEADLLILKSKIGNSNEVKQVLGFGRKYSLSIHLIGNLRDYLILNQQLFYNDQIKLYKEIEKIKWAWIFIVICILFFNMIKAYEENKKNNILESKLKNENEKSNQLKVQLIEARNLSKVGTWLFDLRDNSLTWSDELYQMFEVDSPKDKVELYGIYRSLIHVDDLFLLDQIINHAKKSSEEFIYNHRVILKNKGLLHFQCKGVSVRDENGDVICLTGTTQDKTVEVIDKHDKQKAEEIKELTRIIDRVIATSNNVESFITDVLVAITSTDQWAIAGFWQCGTVGDQLELISIYTGQPNRFHEFVEFSKRIRIKSGESLVGLVQKNKNAIWISDISKYEGFSRKTFAMKNGLNSALCFPVMLNENIIGVIDVYSKDFLSEMDSLTLDYLNIGSRIGLKIEKLKTDEVLKKEQRRYQELMQSVNESSIVSITNSQGEIIFVNELFTKISGYSREELLNANHRMLHSGHHSKEFFSEMWKKIMLGEVWSGDICNLNKNGDIYWINITITQSRDERGRNQYMGIGFDVTYKYLKV